LRLLMGIIKNEKDQRGARTLTICKGRTAGRKTKIRIDSFKTDAVRKRTRKKVISKERKERDRQSRVESENVSDGSEEQCKSKNRRKRKGPEAKS